MSLLELTPDNEIKLQKVAVLQKYTAADRLQQV